MITLLMLLAIVLLIAFAYHVESKRSSYIKRKEFDQRTFNQFRGKR